MTETEAKWTERVQQWRDSGLTARKFSTGRGFSAGGLRHWAHRLSRRGVAAAVLTRSPRTKRAAAAVGKDERMPQTTTMPLRSKAPPGSKVRVVRVERTTAAAPLVVEIGAARLSIAHGADVAIVRAALAMLIAATSGGAR